MLGWCQEYLGDLTSPAAPDLSRGNGRKGEEGGELVLWKSVVIDGGGVRGEAGVGDLL